MKHSENSNRDLKDAARARDLISLSRRILSLAHKGLARNEYLKKISSLLISFCDCDHIELRVLENRILYCCGVDMKDPGSFYIERREYRKAASGSPIPCFGVDTDLEGICEEVISGKYSGRSPYFSSTGSFRIGDTSESFDIGGERRTVAIENHYRSLAIIPFAIEGHYQGLIILKAVATDHFSGEKMELYEEIAQILGISFTYRHAQVALRERVKELTCLYGIAKVAARPGISMESILQNAVNLLPPGWLYPEFASARITLDDGVYVTDGFDQGIQRQSADIFADGLKRGVVEIVYRRKMPDLDEGPFLKEERELINAIANEIALIIERKEAEEEKSRLREQLRHADRLATIGQLAAGVAHELNEPLGSILGFSQLALKSDKIPAQTVQDIEKIENASLYAREIVRKLMIFARQAPPRKENVNLSNVVEEGLYFLASRCQKAGIELIRKLDPNLPDIVADRSQMYQVLVNLVVNAIQATPDGGEVSITTRQGDDYVALIVEDNGFGIEENVLKKIFMPFFTTKDVDEGTGLGLSVVHGIVTAHEGFVLVHSEVGHGSKFEVRLPIHTGGKSKLSQENQNA
ncbi:MAG: hypothetical protein DRP46_05240 [Candidatus Zixiibacteriota bacterium]|nr:MAG: hypothetical protein DRP46_05240 [candidate division Zixibacteria bacterium]